MLTIHLVARQHLAIHICKAPTIEVQGQIVGVASILGKSALLLVSVLYCCISTFQWLLFLVFNYMLPFIYLHHYLFDMDYLINPYSKIVVSLEVNSIYDL